MNKERVELGDIDLDLSPSKRPLILQKIKEERGKNFNKDIDELSKANLGCTLIATFGTEGTRSTILTACRGYRSEEFPDGIEVDIAQYLSSLVPQERGFLWTLDEVLNGNEEKGRKPVKVFINEVNQYPGLLDIMMGIEGLVNKRSSHASGVILFDEDPYEFGSFMKTPNGDIITAFDLHLSEAMGMTKYDFLVTEIQDKITETIKLLQKDNKIEPELSLREVYDKYLHPNVLPIDDQKYWKHMQDNDILNLFQFDSDVGSQAAKKIKPTSIIEMSDANGLMRLMTSEKGQETPMEKYIRYKNDINLWYTEMDSYGLTKEEQKYLKPHFLVSHGVPPSQEQLMTMLMDENICNFSLKDANAARKIVGKKQMNKIPKLKAQIFAQCTSQKLAQYVWDCGVGPQMGYSFSKIHALAYSFIGFQTIFLAVNWNPIYWNTACLIVNSGSLEEQEEEEIVSIYEKEDDPDVTYEDLPDRSGKKKKSKTTDYKKVAKALSDIISKNIKVSLIDINKSNYTFEPDIENNEILFGLKALSGINSNVIEQIIAGRPYLSLKDFMKRCPLNKTAMVSLIKSGAFDKLESQAAADIKVESRILVMAYYLSQVCEPKKRLTLQNFNGLVSYNLLPDTLDFQKKVFSFNKYLKERKSGIYYVFDEACENFYSQHFENELLNIINGVTCIEQKTWEKIYKKEMEKAKSYIAENQQTMLDKYNEVLFKEIWDKYGAGTVSSWEMESLCFYYHEHELKNINKNRYGIVNFNNLNSTPDIDSTFKRNGKDIPIYKIYRIAGTVISKDDNKASIGLLTPDGIVTVKLTKEYYAMINKRVSEKQEDGTKKIVEKGWTTRGTKLLLQGFRRDDQFITKTYSKTVGHQVYLIESIDKNGNLELRHDRKGDLEDED